jgi:hypothetical protein
MVVARIGMQLPRWFQVVINSRVGADGRNVSQHQPNEWTQRVDATSGRNEWTQRVDATSGRNEWTQRVDATSGRNEWTQG